MASQDMPAATPDVPASADQIRSVVAPLVGELAASRQTIERLAGQLVAQAETIGRLAAENETLRASGAWWRTWWPLLLALAVAAVLVIVPR